MSIYICIVITVPLRVFVLAFFSFSSPYSETCGNCALSRLSAYICGHGEVFSVN